MKKKIAIMLTLILATGTFTACTAEEKTNNGIKTSVVSQLRMFLYLRKARKQQQKKQPKQQLPKKPLAAGVLYMFSVPIGYQDGFNQ